jgi:hypothetical protein
MLEIITYVTYVPEALGPTQPPIQWPLGKFSPELKEPGCEADIHLHLVPRFRMSGAVPPIFPRALMECIGTTLLYLPPL